MTKGSPIAGRLERPVTYRISLWLLGIIAMGLVISAAGAVLFAGREGESVEAVGLAGLAILFAVGIVEGLASRVVLGAESLEVVSSFKRTTVPRAEIVRVVGEKGVPVAVQLRSGEWLKLPRLGTGPHANTVRAWVKRASS